jgi:hypothetical protein
MAFLRQLGLWRTSAAVLTVPFIVLAVLDPEGATAVAAGLALVGAVWTLDHADRLARRARTAEYRARWDHPEFLDTRVAAAEFLSSSEKSGDERWDEWLSTMDAKHRLQVMAVLNYWEEVASAYNQDLLDGAWFRTDLAWQLEHNWGRAGWFIRKFRVEQTNAAFFSEWQIAEAAVRADLEQQQQAGQALAQAALSRGEDLLDVAQPPRGR